MHHTTRPAARPDKTIVSLAAIRDAIGPDRLGDAALMALIRGAISAAACRPKLRPELIATLGDELTTLKLEQIARGPAAKAMMDTLLAGEVVA